MLPPPSRLCRGASTAWRPWMCPCWSRRSRPSFVCVRKACWIYRSWGLDRCLEILWEFSLPARLWSSASSASARASADRWSHRPIRVAALFRADSFSRLSPRIAPRHPQCWESVSLAPSLSIAPASRRAELPRMPLTLSVVGSFAPSAPGRPPRSGLAVGGARSIAALPPGRRPWSLETVLGLDLRRCCRSWASIAAVPAP